MPFRRAHFGAALFTALCLVAFAPSCSRSNDDEDDGDAPETALPAYVPSAAPGTIKGTITFAGAAPARDPISMTADSSCNNPDAKSEEYVINGDKVQNVFVYVKDGTFADGKKVNAFSYPPKTTDTVLDQHGCTYHPHILGMQAGQTLSIRNSDPATHNVNVQAQKNDKINPSQAPGAPDVKQLIKRPEILIPVRCNQHPWMRAYIGVVGHPFWDVSKEDGSFEIPNLPPGTYTLVAWHEKLKPEKTIQVTVGAGETKTLDPGAFAWDNSSISASNEVDGGSLTVMPALEFPMLGMPKHH
jgi:hypothetical protein